MSNRKKVGVLGSGSWATAIVKMLCENLDTVYWCVKDEYVKGYIENHDRNPKYLTSVEFDIDLLNLSSDVVEFVNTVDIVILAAPSIYLKDILNRLEKDAFEGKFVFSAIKGLIPEYNDIVGHYMHDEYKVPYENIGVMVGPCHAEEVALERLSYLTIAALQEENAQFMRECLQSSFIYTSHSDDIYGTEYAAVLKNIFAIGAGVAHGIGFGDNYQAVLMSNAIREMQGFLQVIHPIERDIKNSAYLGDLLVTGYSYFSRNRMLGNMIGKGYTVKSAMLEMQMVAEGYYATKGIFEIAKKNAISMPITESVYSILYDEKNCDKVFEKLSKNLN